MYESVAVVAVLLDGLLDVGRALDAGCFAPLVSELALRDRAGWEEGETHVASATVAAPVCAGRFGLGFGVGERHERENEKEELRDGLHRCGLVLASLMGLYGEREVKVRR